MGFVFDAQTGTMRNDLNMPSILGQLVDARCYLSDGYAWFFYQQLAGGHTTNHCVVIDRKGIVVATANTVSNDGSWLGNIGAKCAVGSLLFAATDEGIVQLKLDGSQIVEARSFPDTEPFVNQNCEIFVSQEGMYVVDPHRILRLEIT